ncbi:MAG: DUF1761 domain-containing protein [Candidatus Campbellbacteria bacterium]|nr:DUF1761 domain-containing protein [Candidatus Campbellbacteria bacterium]
MYIYINFTAIFAASVASFLLGWLWYSDFIFGRRWRTLNNVSEESHQQMSGDKKKMTKSMVLYFVSLVVMVGVLARTLFYMGAYGIGDGISTALWMWIGFVVPSMLGMVLWEKKSWEYYFINVGYLLLALITSGVILTLWR